MSDASELRQDIVTGDWVLIAPGRRRRSRRRLVKSSKRKTISVSACPFEDIKKASGGASPLLQLGAEAKWRVSVINNKFPAMVHQDKCSLAVADGMYQHREAVGRHELLITRDHRKNLSALPVSEAVMVFSALAERVRVFAKDSCLEYASLFQNHGFLAGGSQSHPHLQIIAIPIIPPDVAHSLHGAARYFKAHGACAHCDVIRYELGKGDRIIFENAAAVVLAPYASVDAYEFRVYPKMHRSRFESATEAEIFGVVEALQNGLSRMKKALHDPDYNLFIHGAPLKRADGDEKYYHWHIEVFPKTNELAGFELGTGMVINPVAPEQAAKVMRDVIL